MGKGMKGIKQEGNIGDVFLLSASRNFALNIVF